MAPIALIMRAPTLLRTARLGAGKLLPKEILRAATLPPVPIEKDSLRATDNQELVAIGKSVNQYSKLSNTSTRDATRMVVAAFEPYIKKVITDAVGAELTARESTYKTQYGEFRDEMYAVFGEFQDKVFSRMDELVEERNEMFREFRLEFSTRMDKLESVRDKKFADQYKMFSKFEDEMFSRMDDLKERVNDNRERVMMNTRKLSYFDRLKDSVAFHIFGGATALLGVLYYGASYVHADGAAKPTLARALSDAIAPPKLPPKDGTDLEKMMVGFGRVHVGEDALELAAEVPPNQPLPAGLAILLHSQLAASDEVPNAPQHGHGPSFFTNSFPQNTVVPGMGAPQLDKRDQGSSAETVFTGLEDTSSAVHGHTISAGGCRRFPSIRFDDSDHKEPADRVKFYFQLRDEKNSSSRTASGNQVTWRLMNRQDASLGWYQHPHGSDFSLDRDDIPVLIQWGRTFSNDGAAEKDLIKSGLKNLPLSLNDTSDEGKAASQVLQKMLSQSLTTFKVEDAIARAKTPRDADTVNAAKKQKSSADAPAG